MEFFDKKQDVIDLQITQFGRHLMSKGVFKPAYYSFFDDNILYESEKAGIEEEQNRSQERIKEGQRTQPQIGFSSLDREFRNTYELILDEEERAAPTSFQRTAEKNYLLPMPLGGSSIDTNTPPSWQVEFLKGTLSGSTENFEIQGAHGGHYTVPIPQLYTQKDIMVATDFTVETTDEVEDNFQVLSDVILSDEGDLFILLKILEKNGNFQRKNFDIEVFEIIESEENGVERQDLRPLSFLPKLNSAGQGTWMSEEVPELDKNYIGYYFDIKADDEIDDEILCQLDPAEEKRGVFSDAREKRCAEVLGEDKLIVRDIYSDEEDYPGEIC